MVYDVIKKVSPAIAPVLALVLLIMPTDVVGEELVTLDEVRQAIPERHETQEITELQIRQSRAMQRQALAALLPQLNASANVTRHGGEEVEIGGQTFRERYDWSVGSVASIALFDGPAYFEYWRSEAMVEFTEQSAMWQRKMLLLEGEVAFFTLASAQREVEIAESAIEQSRQYVEQAEALVEAGLAVTVDISRARTQVLEAEQTRLEAEAALGDAADALATLLGREAAGQLRADFDPAQVEVEFPDEAMAVDVTRADFAGRVSQIEAAELGRRGIWWSLAPRLELRLNNTWGQTTDFNPERHNWSLTLAATWNLYDGGARYARADAAQAEVRQLELELQRDLRDADTELVSALRQWRSTAARIEVATQQVELAQEVYEQTMARFESGLATSIEVSDATQELLNAELRLNQIRLQARLAEVRYRYLEIDDE